MPIVDMPLAELKTYMGVNPRPADHDEYWQRALAELDSFDWNVQKLPAAFTAPNAECYDLYYTGVRGARIHAKLLMPAKRTEKLPAVCEFHGYSGNCGDWAGKLGLVGCGFVVASMDVRGQGGLSEDVGGVFGNTLNGHIIRGLLNDNPDDLLFRHIFLDTAQLARIVMGMEEVDETRVFAQGGSQGGGLTLACASLEPRIRKLAPHVPFLCDYKRVWDMDLDVDAYAELRKFFRDFDPRHLREEEIFTRLGYIDVQYLTPRIKGEVMMFTGLMDTICPPSTQFAAYNKITSKKEVMIYPDFGHESMPGQSDLVLSFFLR